MPLKTGALTSRETKFLEAYASNGFDRRAAERAAGFAAGTGYSVLARPEIQRRVMAHQMARLTNDALPAAVDTLLEIMTNKKAPAAARVTAAKVVFDRVLPDDASRDGREPHEMTPEELAARINALTAAAASRARDVTPADPGADAFD